MNRFRIRKGRMSELWGGAWQVWELLDIGGIPHKRLVCAWRTHADCVTWLDELQKGES